MRTFITSLMAFFISGFAGGIIAQLIAEKTYATEEFVLAFMASALFTIVTTALFFIAQMTGNPVSTVGRLGRRLLAVVCVLAFALVVFAAIAEGLHIPGPKEAWLLIGLTLPGIVTVLTQWWFVRWRVGNNPVQFRRAS